MSTQLDLLAAVEPYREPQGVNGRQHRAVLLALLAEGERGLTGEEASVRCGIRLASSATTRLEEMSKDSKVADRFPVPLVFRSERKERATASGRLAFVWWLTDVGRVEAEALRAEAP